MPRGRLTGRKTVKPRSDLTTFQSVIVVGVPGPVVGVGELPTVAVVVAVGEPPGVTVEVGVAVAVAVGTAPSSRNNMLGLPHQVNFASGKSAESVAVGTGCEDAKGFEHEASSIPASSALNAR